MVNYMADYSRYLPNNEYVSDSVNLLISLLIRYPELATIKFLPENNSLKLTFLLTRDPERMDFEAARQFIANSIDAYHLLKGTPKTSTSVLFSFYEQVAILDIMRDVISLSQNEIALIVRILNEHYNERLISDYHDAMPEDDLLVQEEFISDMLENIKRQHLVHGLIGIREEGRVFVFDK